MTSHLTRLERLVDLVRGVAGYDEIQEHVVELGDCADRSLVAPLCERLDTFLTERDYYGRDVIAEVLARLAGVDALPVLLRAMAHDLDDDQDTLEAEVYDLLVADPVRSRPFVQAVADDTDPRVREIGVAALALLDDADGHGSSTTLPTV